MANLEYPYGQLPTHDAYTSDSGSIPLLGFASDGLRKLHHLPQLKQRLLLALMFSTGCLAGLLCTSVFGSNVTAVAAAVELHSNLTPPLKHRAPPIVHLGSRHNTPAGGSASVSTLSWYSDAIRANESMTLCQFTNLCVQHRMYHNKRDTIQYYLLSDVDKPNYPFPDEKKLHGCLRTWKSPPLTLGLRDSTAYKEPISWVNGTTFATPKGEYGSHPFSWMIIWATFSSVIPAAAKDLLAGMGVRGDRFFDHYQLLGESFDLCGWSQFLMQTATAAARKALRNLREEAVVDSGARRRQLPTYSDDSRFRNGDGKGMTCFESVLTIQPGRHFFRDKQDAALFRQKALASLGLPSHRPVGCTVRQLTVLLWRRDDRPIWNEAEVLSMMHETGLRNIEIVSVTADTPYQDQIDLWNSADIIVSAHGSHIQNMVFMQPGSAVVEIFPTLFYHAGQQALANKLEVHHVEITNTSLVPEELVRKKQPASMHRWKEVKRITEKYPTLEACSAARECLLAVREFGVYVEPDRFSRILSSVVSGLTDPKGCI